MIFAELRGKLGSCSTRVHERLEDLLTSTAFGLLRYAQGGDGLLRVLRHARCASIQDGRFRVSRNERWLIPQGARAVKLDFWPSWKEYGQPDVLASLMDEGKKMLGRILVEVKLYSPKSGVADVDAESTTEEAAPDPDQLVKYWQGLKRITPSDVEAAIVYLTAHPSPPVIELETAFRRMPGMRLGWLSWFEVEREARKIATATGDLPAADLSALLRHKGLSYFDGFKAVAPGARARGHFWKGASGQSNARRRWFGYPALVLKSRERFWRLR